MDPSKLTIIQFVNVFILDQMVVNSNPPFYLVNESKNYGKSESSKEIMGIGIKVGSRRYKKRGKKCTFIFLLSFLPCGV